MDKMPSTFSLEALVFAKVNANSKIVFYVDPAWKFKNWTISKQKFSIECVLVTRERIDQQI